MNVKNELTSAVGLGCWYDANGNLTSRVYDANGPKSYTYIYDDENQLIEMRTDTYYTPSGSRFKTTWTYDGLGRARVRQEFTWNTAYGQWQSAGETRYIYDGMRVIQERNASNTPTVSYTRGRDLSGSLEGAGGIGGLLGRSHGYSSGTWSTHNHYHADGNGNVTFLVNSGQTAEAWYRYDPYGRTMAQSATTLTTDNLYRFSSKEIHAKSGMYYYGFRFYDPHLLRWPNRDPLEEKGHALLRSGSTRTLRNEGTALQHGIWPRRNRFPGDLYVMVRNSPVTYVDAFGLELTEEDCQRFLNDCLLQVEKAKLRAVLIGTGIGAAGAVGGLLIRAGGIYVAGGGIIVGLAHAAHAIDCAEDEAAQCRGLHERCMDSVWRRATQ